MIKAITRSKHIDIIDSLRGIAATLVCLVHLGGIGLFGAGILTTLFSFGQFGVYIFFVISGFIIPYSMDSSGYQLRYFFKYIFKRSIRIDPPYYVAILLTLLLMYLVTIRPGFSGTPFHFSIYQFLAHLIYIIPLTNYDWYSHVFWTLCIEFQYYLFMGLFYTLLMRFNNYIYLIVLFFFLISCLLPFNTYYSLSTYSSAFVLGIVTFYYKKDKIGLTAFLSMVAVISIFYFIVTKSPAIALTSLLTALSIGLIRHKDRITGFLGKISYSLYITHTLILTMGGYFAKRYTMTVLEKFAFMMVELAFCLLFAFVYYTLLEKRFLSLSKRVSIIPVEEKN